MSPSPRKLVLGVTAQSSEKEDLGGAGELG